MTVSRRDVLLQGSVIGAGLIAANVTGIEALAQGQPPLRQSLGNLQLNDPVLQAWRDGVAQLKANPASNPISWANFALIHGTASDFNKCPHGNWYFLPWHRAFLLMYERTVRQLTGHNDFALPYWDWTNNPQLPAAFTQPTFNGASNSLFEPQRDASPTDSLDPGIVGQTVIDRILSQADFEAFGTSRPNQQGNVQNSLDPSWIRCERCGVKGELEYNPHDLVHGFVGGLMASSQSALDPIFMMHHCNIDRLWAVWNANNPNTSDSLWTDMVFQDSSGADFYNPDGSPFAPKVSDLYTPETLGYTYGLPPPAGPALAARPAAVVALSDKLKTIFATPNLRGAAGVRTFTAQNAQNETATAEKPLEIPLEVDRYLMSAVARHPSPSSGTELLNFNAVREQRASGTRALAFIRDIAFTHHKNTMYRVFIDCDYLSQATPIADPHYVGTFGDFGNHHGYPGGGKPAPYPSIAVDLTGTIRRLYGSAAELSGRIRVQIMPVSIRPKAGPAGTAAPSRIEVAFVSS